MFCLTLGMELIGAKAVVNSLETHCVVCGEPINYNPPDYNGTCSCGYSTDEGS